MKAINKITGSIFFLLCFVFFVSTIGEAQAECSVDRSRVLSLCNSVSDDCPEQARNLKMDLMDARRSDRQTNAGKYFKDGNTNNTNASNVNDSDPAFDDCKCDKGGAQRNFCKKGEVVNQIAYNSCLTSKLTSLLSAVDKAFNKSDKFNELNAKYTAAIDAGLKEICEKEEKEAAERAAAEAEAAAKAAAEAAAAEAEAAKAAAAKAAAAEAAPAATPAAGQGTGAGSGSESGEETEDVYMNNDGTTYTVPSNGGAAVNTSYSGSGSSLGSGELFGDLARHGGKIFTGLREIIYAVSGFGIIAVVIGAIFGNINYKWLTAIIIGLFVIAATAAIINYMVDEDVVTPDMITDSLKSGQ